MTWSQWCTILWLRWCLTRNQWARSGALGTLVSTLLITLLASAVAVSCLTGFYLGMTVFARTPPLTLLFLWNGFALVFLFFWMIGVMMELQRSESLDLGRFLHLPVSLRGVFIFNYLASWVTPSILIALPGGLCLIAGQAIARGPQMLWLVPVIIGFFAMVTSLTYLLRGWLASLMSSPRRRQSVIMVVTILFIGITQLPNLYFQSGRSPRGKPLAIPQWYQAAQNYFPPFWVARAAGELAVKTTTPAFLAMGGLFTLAGLGLFQAYRGTTRFYRGAHTGAKVAAPERVAVAPVSRFLERKIPGLSNEVSAVALATLRSHLRAPEIKMVIFGQLLMSAVFGIMIFRPMTASAFANFQPLVGVLIGVMSLFGSSQLVFNQFGWDRDAFRAYVLAPVSRRSVLLGKNLATLPFVTLIGLLLLVAALAAGLLGPVTFLSSIVTFIGGFFLFALLGNLVSIVAPFRLAQGGLKAAKLPPSALLAALFTLLLSSIASVMMFLPSGLEILCKSMKWFVGMPVLPAASSLLLLLAGWAYFATLAPLGRLLHKREQKILHVVTSEVE